MERLTEKSNTGYFVRPSKGGATLIYAPGKDVQQRYEGEIIDRLAHYEDLEEQGQLVELPCKIGDTVYDICNGMAYATRVLQFVMFQDGNLACRTVSSFPNIDQFGARIFLSEKEAEAALSHASDALEGE